MMQSVGRILMGTGLLMFLIGLGVYAASRFGLRRLPGDFAFRAGHLRIYFPLATSLIVSVLLSLILYLLSILSRR